MHRKNEVVMMMKVQNVNYFPQAYLCGRWAATRKRSTGP